MFQGGKKLFFLRESLILCSLSEAAVTGPGLAGVRAALRFASVGIISHSISHMRTISDEQLQLAKMSGVWC